MKRIVIAGITLGILAGVGVWGVVWWNSPANTQHYTSSSDTSVLGNEVKLLPWHTRYFSTRYPSTLRTINSNEVARGNILGQYLLGSTSLEQTDQLAVTIGKMGGLTLDQIPAVKLRAQQTDNYYVSNLSYAPQGSRVYSSSGSYETAVFWQYDADKYAAIVVSGSSVRHGELETVLESILANWQSL